MDKDLLDALWPDLCAAAVLEELAVLALGGDAGRGVVLLHADGHLEEGSEAGGRYWTRLYRVDGGREIRDWTDEAG